MHLKSNKVRLDAIIPTPAEQFLRLTSQIETIGIILLLSLMILAVTTSPVTAQAQLKCESLFANSENTTTTVQQESSRTQVKDLNSLGQAVTEGRLLKENDIFEIYLKVFMGDPNTGVGGKTLQSVTDILKQHPELTKPMFTEYLISSVEKVYETPEALSKYIKSQSLTAAQVRNNLFQIEANLDFWKKILDYKEASLPEHLKPLNLGKNATAQEKSKAREINKARAEWQSQAQKRFITYLNRIISKTNRDLLADLKSESITYEQKTRALFETLKHLENWMSQKGRDTQALRQAMLDLVYTIGYGGLVPDLVEN